jgi:ABC-type Fe3+ transport system permease subunit
MKTWQAAVVSLLAGVLGAVLGAVIGFGVGLLVLQGCRERMECEGMWAFWFGGGVVFGVAAAVISWGVVRPTTDKR